MVVTTRVRLDRIASPPGTPRLPPEVIVGDEIVAAEGYVLAVRILEDKSTYNTVEDVTGRMLSLRAGDVLAGMLGTRRALRGYAGVVPPHIAVGDTIEVLNLGGILGKLHVGQSRTSARRSRPRCSAPSSPFPSWATGSAGRRTSATGRCRRPTRSRAACRWCTSPAPA